MCSVYILFSENLDKFYIGSTSVDVKERIRRHLSNHKGFTAKAKDWKIVYEEFFSDIIEARGREKQLKNWKNRKRIEELIDKAK